MLVNAIEHSDVELTKEHIMEIGDLLESNQLRVISLRNCKISDVNFKRLMKSSGRSKSLLQMSLSVGVISDQQRIELLAQALRKNKLLKSLHIHGNPIGDEGLKVIAEALSYNSHVTTLDVGDCDLGDAAIQHLRLLLMPTAEQEGLSELGLSANTRISEAGWASLAMTVAHSPNLRRIFLDYNNLGNIGASSLVVGVAANQQIEVLDLEGTGVTEETAQLLLDLMQNYPGKLRKITLSENKVKKSTVAAIKSILRINVPDGASTDASEDDFLSTTASVSSSQGPISCTSDAMSETSTSATEVTDTEDSVRSETSTVKDLVLTDIEDPIEKTQAEKVDASKKKKKKKVKDEEDEDLGEELKEVPVFW
ncbi:leucine-rich repeat-containing protein 73-like [Haliotis rubra]|uniref:leucine-rich repeat-containing protein 73-like n=1 Tax=Haliotis rubra TaxID=36100 RepID=UPI001EE5E964|nr:leucine-rich repeat-containing protein 73-like [Haliotis rubra]